MEQVVGEHRGALGGHAGEVVEHPADVLEPGRVREGAEDLQLEADGLGVGHRRRPAELGLEGVEDQPVLDLLRLPDVGVEVPVDLRRVGEHRRQLEHVAVDLELDAGHVVEHVAEPLAHQVGAAHGEVHVVQPDRRVLLGDPVDVGAEAEVGRGTHTSRVRRDRPGRMAATLRTSGPVTQSSHYRWTKVALPGRRAGRPPGLRQA